MSTASDLRTRVGVAPDQYRLGDDVFWTDEQLAAVLTRHVHYQSGLDLVVVDIGSADDVLTAKVDGLLGDVDPTNPGTISDPDGIEILDWTITAQGIVVFGEDSEGALPLYWSGATYDLAGAAAEVLTSWAGAMASAYDVKMDGQEMSRSQMADRLTKLASEQASLAVGAGGGIQSIPTRTEGL